MSNTRATFGVDLHLELGDTRPRASIERALREAVRDGRLLPASRLPSSRALAADLGVGRNTVAEAYGQLVAEGWLTAVRGSATRVAERLDRGVAIPEPGTAPAGIAHYDLSPGAPDVSAFPRTAWLAAAKQALGDAPAAAFGYADPRGVPELRLALAEYLSRVRGVRVQAQDVVVCSGFTHGLRLVAGALVGRGHKRLAVESYGLAVHRDIVRAAGLEPVALTVDAEGARVGELPELDGVRAALLTPAHQYPLGPVLAAARRIRAVAWAAEVDGLIIDDDYDGEFRYDRHPVGSMQALAPDRVVYAGTASKTLAPGLRLGWLVVPPELIDAVVDAKAGFHTQSTLDQLTLARFIASGGYDRHVRRTRLAYRKRRDRLVAAVSELVPAVRVTGIAAGLHLVLVLPQGVEEEEVVSAAARRGLRVQGVSEAAASAHTHPPALVVGYATPAEHAFSGALTRLTDTLLAVGQGAARHGGVSVEA